MAETKIIPELDPSRDLAVLKTNGSFSGTFTTSSGTVTISYGDGNEETSNTPSHTFNTKPPYILNIDNESSISEISISGNNLSMIDVTGFPLLENIDARSNSLSSRRVEGLLTQIDENGLENGTIDIRDNPFVADDVTEQTIINLANKGWTINGLYRPVSSLAWYDSSDTSTITEDSNAVSQWDDKSSNERHLINGTSVQQPTTNTRTINGLNVLDADGINQYLFNNTNFEFPDSGNFMLFVIAEVDSSDDFNDAIWAWEDDVDIQLDTARNNGEMRGRHFVPQTGNDNNLFSTTNVGGVPNLWSTVLDFDSSENNIYLDGSLGVNSPKTYTTKISTTGTRQFTVMLGGFPIAFSHLLDGAIGELVLVEGADSVTRQKIEGYLAHKWGLESNLPISHPYKNEAP